MSKGSSVDSGEFVLDAPARKAHESHAADTDVWLTPPHIVQALGDFDLDPCAAIDQPWATARHQYTKQHNGLNQPWYGRVWLNPPYGSETGKWLTRLAHHGDGIALVFARTETALFFEAVWGYSHAILFLRGRLKFYYTNGTACRNSAGAPSCLVAYGSDNATALRDSGLDGYFVKLKGACEMCTGKRIHSLRAIGERLEQIHPEIFGEGW